VNGSKLAFGAVGLLAAVGLMRRGGSAADPRKRYDDLTRMAAPGSGASDNERNMALRLLAKMKPPPPRPTRTPRARDSWRAPRSHYKSVVEPWQVDHRDFTDIYREDFSDLNFCKKSIYEHASDPKVRVALYGFNGRYSRGMFTVYSSLDDLGYAGMVFEAWGSPFFKKNGAFEAVIASVEREGSKMRLVRIRGIDVFDLGLVIEHNSFNANPFNDMAVRSELNRVIEQWASTR